MTMEDILGEEVDVVAAHSSVKFASNWNMVLFVASATTVYS